MEAPSRGKQTSCGPAGCPVTSPPARSNHFTAPLHCTKRQLAPRCSSSGSIQQSIFDTYLLLPLLNNPRMDPQVCHFFCLLFHKFLPAKPGQRQQPPKITSTGGGPVPSRTIRGWGRRSRFDLWICRCFKRYFWNHRGVALLGARPGCGNSSRSSPGRPPTPPPQRSNGMSPVSTASPAEAHLHPAAVRRA